MDRQLLVVLGDDHRVHDRPSRCPVGRVTSAIASRVPSRKSLILRVPAERGYCRQARFAAGAKSQARGTRHNPFGLNDLDFPGFRPELGACGARSGDRGPSGRPPGHAERAVGSRADRQLQAGDARDDPPPPR